MAIYKQGEERMHNVPIPYDGNLKLELDRSRETLSQEVAFVLQSQLMMDGWQKIGEWDRIIRSVAILAREHPWAEVEDLFHTALLWERG